jgi:hypothetical protein
MKMIKELIKLANDLDSRGLSKEADYLDAMLREASDSGLAEHISADSTTEMTLNPDDFSDEDVFDTSPPTGNYGDASPEEQLLSMISASEELAGRLGLKYMETEMTAEELKERLMNVLNLENLSEEEQDSVLKLAIRLLASPMQMLGGTPRVRERI